MTNFGRTSTGMTPLDHMLGGGLVAGSVALLAGAPGIGKTQLTLQLLAGLQHSCLCVTGEETPEQIAATARHVGVVSEQIYVLAERSLAKIFERARAMSAQTIAIDSIQTMICDTVSSRAGSPSQLKACAERLVDYARTTDTAVWVIGHVTSKGAIAGPEAIQHVVDVVLELKRGAKYEGNERILKCSKNRYGSTAVTGHFELTSKGLIAHEWNEKR